jgi:hypothetical protein
MGGRKADWLINDSADETKEYLFNQIKKGVEYRQIAKNLNVTRTKIANFVAKHLQDDVKAWKKEHGEMSRKNTSWWVNESEEDTTKKIIEFIKVDMLYKDMAKYFGCKSYDVKNFANRRGLTKSTIGIDAPRSQQYEYEEIDKDNRLFSMTVIGSTEEALRRTVNYEYVKNR